MVISKIIEENGAYKSEDEESLLRTKEGLLNLLDYNLRSTLSHLLGAMITSREKSGESKDSILKEAMNQFRTAFEESPPTNIHKDINLRKNIVEKNNFYYFYSLCNILGVDEKELYVIIENDLDEGRER